MPPPPIGTCRIFSNFVSWGMPDLTLTNIPPALLQEWTEYASQSGLPLEYLILEAVTYSVRSDRLGVEAARLVCAQRQKSLALAKKHVQRNGPTPQESFQEPAPLGAPLSPPPAAVPLHPQHPATSDSDEASQSAQVVHNVPREYMDSNESSAALEDFVPRHL